MAKTYKVTVEGLEKYKEELEYLKTTGRTDIAEKIKTARGFGDLSENSEYDEAKNDQGKLEARILELEEIIKNAEVIDNSEMSDDSVHVGATVKVHDLDFDEVVEYKIVGASEADPAHNLISEESPVGKTLLGKKKGERVDVEVPDGIIQFDILEIKK